MRIQRASEGQKYGDTNPDHVLGMKLAMDYWTEHTQIKDSKIDISWIEPFDWVFLHLNAFPDDKFAGYRPDIFIYHDVVVRGNEFRMPVLIIEIDGKKHDTVEQKIKDQIYEKWIYYHYCDTVEVIRLKTREMNGPQELAIDYIRKKLINYCH